ncbi:MAG: hypothetical protein M3R05_04125 [Chloroflexota bacterium]|nr:hypothetical protein [Chloroflexota bacterium]
MKYVLLLHTNHAARRTRSLPNSATSRPEQPACQRLAVAAGRDYAIVLISTLDPLADTRPINQRFGDSFRFSD